MEVSKVRKANTITLLGAKIQTTGLETEVHQEEKKRSYSWRKGKGGSETVQGASLGKGLPLIHH